VAPCFITEAFRTEEGIENPSLNVGTLGFLYYEVDAVTPSRQMPLEEVRDQVVSDWLARERTARLSALAREVQQRIEAGESIEAVAEELGVEVENKYGLNRSTDDPDLGNEGIEAVFSVPQGSTATLDLEDGRNYVVFTVTDVSYPLAAGPDTVDENTRQAMASRLSNDLLDQLVTRLQGAYSVTVNQRAIQQALSF
jgi:peptidyl-prolyl cis-trans isomerase D